MAARTVVGESQATVPTTARHDGSGAGTIATAAAVAAEGVGQRQPLLCTGHGGKAGRDAAQRRALHHHSHLSIET